MTQPASGPVPVEVGYTSPGTTKTAQFFIPASASLQERRPRTLKHDDTFGVFDHNGDVLSGPGSPEGIFHRDTRHLSHLYMTLNGQRPLLLSSTVRDNNAILSCDLTNPDILDAQGRTIVEHDLLHIRRSRFLWQARSYERLAVHNYDIARQRFRLQLEYASDFADIFEVRGTEREKRGADHVPKVQADQVLLAYTGLDHQRRETRLRFEPAPQSISASMAVFDVDLGPGETKMLYVEIGCAGATPDISPRLAFGAGLRDVKRELRLSSSRAASLSSSNEIFNESARRSVSDLYMLVTETPNGPYPYAGIPWFSTVFGRDALITAMQTLWLDPSIGLGVLRHLAANQAVSEDAAADAEPGKILHEVRYGEMAELGEVPFRRYYGSVDSTPLFVMLAGAYLERTDDLESIRELWPSIEAALEWLRTYGDRDGDGFVEYGRRTSEGLVNQGWKDSFDSVFHEDGRLARGPIALVEVQAYAYAALRAGATIAGRVGASQAHALARRAEILRSDFDRAFFDEKLGTYVLALDGEKLPCRVRSSNAGHALYAGIALPERAGPVVRTLMASSSFSGWGVRTVPTTEARYNPMSYHNGSVWPHDNSMVAAGFARYGYRKEAARIFEGLFDASVYIDLRRLPELFCGFARQRSQGPIFYPVACSPQAWAACAPISLVQSCLGLGFDVTDGLVTFDQPTLPDFMEDITLRQLSVPGGSLDVALSRVNSEVAAHVIARRGHVHVQVTV